MWRLISWPVAAPSCEQWGVDFDNKQTTSLFFLHRFLQPPSVLITLLAVLESWNWNWLFLFCKSSVVMSCVRVQQHLWMLQWLGLHSNRANSWKCLDLNTRTRPLFSSGVGTYTACPVRDSPREIRIAFALDRKITSRECSCVSKSSFEISDSEKF